MRLFFLLVLSLSLISPAFAQAKKEKKLKLPAEAVTAKDKIEFCYQAQEALRLEHNEKGRQFREGEITEAEWLAYKEEYRAKRDAVIEEMLAQKEAMKASTRFTVDLQNIAEDK